MCLLETICQRYILKAIHNWILSMRFWYSIGNDMSKIHFESNSQPTNWATRRKDNWKRYVKDTFWKQFTTSLNHRQFGVYWKRYVKDTFWKQFTTLCIMVKMTQLLETICQRYILKAIHNRIGPKRPSRPIGNDMSKIHFESNSQRRLFYCLKCPNWKRYVKDTFWKQFTTWSALPSQSRNWKRYVKDTFWKQFTTNTSY